MPKQTFFNLPEEKRKRILEIAMQEFASHTYSKASLSNIVAKAGIAKGSMYQYFEDKKDLFMYILDLAAQEKMAYIKGYGFNPDDDFYKVFEKSLLAGTEFNFAHPLLGKIMANSMEPTAEEILKELSTQWRPKALRFFEDLIRKGKQEGSIRPEIDERLITHLLVGMIGTGLTEYILETSGKSMEEMLRNADKPAITTETIKGIVDKIMDFIRNGFAM